MSELIQKSDNRASIRWKLLTGASALALAAYVSSAAAAKAEDDSQPQIWIELGGQFSVLENSQEPFAPHFTVLTPSIFPPPQKAEKSPLYGFGESATLTFQPEGSDWLFSGSIHYGRALRSKHVRHQSYPGAYTYYSHQYWERSFLGHRAGSALTFLESELPIAARFSEVRSKQSETHTIVDFQAGKDVGLGLFGRRASSSLNVGIRFAQFSSKSRVEIGEDPDWGFVTGIYKRDFSHIVYKTIQEVYQPYHSFSGTSAAERSFHGLGPSLSWKSSMPFAGNAQDGELTLDWGVNGALLFGRQRTKVRHQTTGRYHTHGTKHYHSPGLITTYQNPATPHTRSRNVTVPDVGGSVGLSWQLQNFKMSFGYRGDFFFDAIDGGMDARKNENRAFYGPYASISIGIGGGSEQ